VRSQQILVGVENNSELIVGASHPQRQGRGLDPGPDVEGRSGGSAPFPD